MYLLIHELVHILFSLFGGLLAHLIVYGKKIKQKELIIALAAGFAGGVLIDLDHLFDYYLAYGFAINLRAFLVGTYFLINDKIYVLFHGWEYVAIMLATAAILKNRLIALVIYGLAFGMLFHLIVDSLVNAMPPQSYSILNRLRYNFQVKPLVYPEHYQQVHLKYKRP